MRYSYEEKPSVVSDECFRLLTLRVEVQNDVEVVKSVLEELEVMRLSCSLGMLSSVNIRDFTHGMLEAREFDDDFARFLRTDVFKRIPSDPNTLDDDMDGKSDGVRVMSLFGKQTEVQKELIRLGCWSAECEANLRSQDQGIYCAHMSSEQSGQGRVLVLFAWLQDVLFEPQHLRDTATYILRFLTCLSPNIVCCLSAADVEKVQQVVSGLASGKVQEWKSYSVAFRVEKQEDEKDEIRCEHVKSIDLSVISTALNRRMIKGSFPAMAVTTPAPATTRTVKGAAEFESVEAFARWMVSRADEYKVHTNYMMYVIDEDFRSRFLEAVNKVPEEDLQRIEKAFERSTADSEERSKEEAIVFVEEQRALLLGIIDKLFSVDLLLNAAEMSDAASDLGACLSRLKSENDVWNMVDPQTQVVLHLPVRLRKYMRNFYALFSGHLEAELDEILTKIVTTPSKDLLGGSDGDRKSILGAISREIRSWFSSTNDSLDISEDFRRRMVPALDQMKEVWWDAVERTFDVIRATLWKRWTAQHISSARSSCDEDRARVVTKTFVDLHRAWELDAAKNLNCNVSVRKRDGRIVCEISEEKWLPPTEQMEVFKIDLDNAMSSGVRSLGTFPLRKGATVLDVFSIQANAVLVLYSTSGVTTIVRVQFPLRQPYCGSSRGSPSFVKRFGRSMSRCDFLATERLIAFVGTNDDIGLYKFNDQFTSMEVVRSINLRVRTSLSAPLTDMLLLENGIFLRDQTGSAQSVNLRSQQTSRKTASLNCSSIDSSWSSDLVPLADGLVVACLSAVDGETGVLHGEMAAISSEDHRKIPVHLGSEILLLSKDGISVQSIGNYLLVADPLSDEAQLFDVRVTVRSDSYRIRHSGGKNARGQRQCEEKSRTSGDDGEAVEHWLWAFYHVFEKFPVNGLLFSQGADAERGRSGRLQLRLVCPSTSASDAMYEDCRLYFQCVMDHLRKLNKPLGGMDLTNDMTLVAFNGAGKQRLESEVERLCARSIPSFLQDVITFVPIQICRAESNMLTVMTDGQDRSTQVEGLEQSRQLQSADIARSIRFGLLTPLLESWRGRCIVVTSMGKQSTGKSYFLNHLTGSSFAIAGARCTDGAWMTVRVLPNDVLLVVLDFEGLGSFERTEQEDVFLSVLNAAISMFTVFRMEMRFDKEIDEIFSKFQKGVQLIKNDARLFRGKLYMSVKDVNPNDQNGVLDEFIAKFEKLLGANKEHNFLCDMYSGQLDINCSPPLGTSGYYQSLTDAQRFIEQNLCHNETVGFPSGKAFLDCIRLVLAKISILDWTSLDESNVKLQLSEVRSKLPGLIRTGCLVPSDHVADSKPIGGYLREDIALETSGTKGSDVCLQRMCLEYPDMAGKWLDLDRVVSLDSVHDRDIDLGVDCCKAEGGDQGLRAIGASMLRLFEMCLENSGTPVDGKLSIKMQTSFDIFLLYIVRRRRLRILAWVKSLLGDRLPEDWQAVEAQYLGRFQMLFSRCSHICSHCQLGCMQSAAHTAAIEHDCGLSHKCQGRCEYCEDAGGEGKTPRCSKPTGHEGRCECAMGDHTCGKECCMVRATNCGQRCVAKAGHDGMHLCAVEIHRCGMACSAKSCAGLCILSIASPHSAHKCEEMKCVETCSMDGCGELCGEHDHFHGQSEIAVAYSVENPSSGKSGDIFDAESETPTIHMCSKSHACQAMCGEKGNCYVEVFHKESSKTFVGARGEFKYKFQEMNGFRKKCATTLEAGHRTHSGPHTCVDASEGAEEMEEETKESEEESRTLHYCEARCPCCSYFCKKEYGHFGMHATSHGNMRNTYFLADTANIDIEERKYRAGESGNAEMCNLYCSKMGRAHVHYLDCDQTSERNCVYVGDTKDQRRHCTRALEPKPAKEVDELLHEQFWKTLGWEDPCTLADERESFGKCAYECDAPEHKDKKSYCMLQAWHKPEPQPSQHDGFSYISGHKFECSHLVDSGKMHHVFVLDCSGSMEGQPWDQLMAAYREYMYNRVSEGASLDLVSVVTFDNYGKIEYEAQNITTMLRAHVEYRGGGTVYSAGLRSANEILSRNNFETYKPVVVFFSDGQPCDPVQGEELAAHIKQSYAKYGLEAFSVGYGTVNLSILERVAEKLGGSYHSVLLGTELKQAFHTISASLGTRAGLALTKPLHEMTCPICQRDMASEEVVELRPCRHELHKSCKKEMVDSKTRDEEKVLCPMCRKEVVE